jgi:hypothetical protein
MFRKRDTFTNLFPPRCEGFATFVRHSFVGPRRAAVRTMSNGSVHDSARLELNGPRALIPVFILVVGPDTPRLTVSRNVRIDVDLQSHRR